MGEVLPDVKGCAEKAARELDWLKANPQASREEWASHIRGYVLAKFLLEEEKLLDYLWEELSRVPGVELPLGVKPRAGIVSFLLPPFHPYDVAVLLDQQGVAVRSGTHCAQPLLDSMGLSQGTVRVSLGLYNNAQDVARLCAGLRRIAAIKL